MDTRLTDSPAATAWPPALPPGRIPDGQVDAGAGDACYAAPHGLLAGCPVSSPAQASAAGWRAIARPTGPADAPMPNPASFAGLIEQSLPPGLEPNAKVIHRFNRGRCDGGLVLRITSLSMKQCGPDWNAALACADALTRCRRRDPLTGLEELVGPSHFTYAIAIMACQKAGRHDKVLALLHHLQAHGRHLPEPLFLEAEVYAIAISECEPEARAADALALFDHLLAHGPRMRPPAWPGTVAYNGAIATCKKAGCNLAVLRLFHHLQTFGQSYPRKAFPSTETYNMVISTHAKAQQTAEAMALFDRLLSDGPGHRPAAYPDIVSFSIGLAACEKLALFRRYDELLDRGIQGLPDKPETRVFQPKLGFDAVRNELNLQPHSVLIHPKPGYRGGIHCAVARAIFSYLVHSFAELGLPTGINRQTRFVLGPRGSGTLKETIADCMRAHGWQPTHPVDGRNRPDHSVLVSQA